MLQIPYLWAGPCQSGVLLGPLQSLLPTEPSTAGPHLECGSGGIYDGNLSVSFGVALFDFAAYVFVNSMSMLVD